MGNIKYKLLSAFREFFIYNYKYIEFKAKIFAAIMASKNNLNDKDFKILRQIVSEIYPKNNNKADLLFHMIQEYIDKTKDNLDFLLLSIDKDLKMNKKYARKIDLKKIKRFINENNFLQIRVYEFLENERKIYLQN